MKDASERFFSIAINHPNPLISSGASYEPPPTIHFIRRTQNVLTDPLDDLTTKVEKLNNALKDLRNRSRPLNQSTSNGLTPGALTAHRCHPEVLTRVETSRTPYAKVIQADPP
ncbi:hypothetical protein EVAR_98131_1 [Eumeta japonica]|uniref:Uncharacterized protein n=1 Tax=Eumeta variegata TaxID=151549 RepID=A0A4C1XQS4_EUMVA|nr:hypothetical protein EVAR_98131_1 [Eumeta japonica]